MSARARRSGLFLALALLAVGCGRRSDEGSRPNVLLVTLDTTRPDFMSTYGYASGRTPAFDAIADEGVRFERAVSSSAVTPVAHASILTGLFQYRHGLRVLSAASGFRLPRDRRMLSEILADAGYRTLAVHSAFPVSGYFGFARSFDVFEDVSAEFEPVGDRGEDWDLDFQRRSDETTDRALAAIDRSVLRDPRGTGAEPFFFWVHYWDPHDQRKLPPRRFLPRKNDADPDAIYASEVRYMDEQFGRLVEGLRERGLYEDTIVVVTADHGQGLSDGVALHGWPNHRMVYREQIEVPLLVRAPGIAAADRGRVVGDVVRTVDIVPTVLDYLDLLDAAGPLDGRSLRPLIEGRPDAPRVAYADQINGYDTNAFMVEKRPDAAFLYSVMDGEWKLVYRPHMPGRSELFRYSTDPLETQNLYDQRPDEVRRLLRDLAERRPWVTAPFTPEDESGGPTGDGVGEALGALGYVEGELYEGEWIWTCPEHTDLRAERGDACPVCGNPLVPASRAE